MRRSIGRLPKMLRRTKLLVAAVGLVAVTAAIPWLVPLAWFIPQVQAGMSERIGAPVKIGALRIALLPLPHITAKHVMIGDGALGHIGQIRLWPRLPQLLSKVKVIREVRLDDVVLTEDLAAQLIALPLPRGPKRLRVERLVLKGGELRLRGATLRELSAKIDLDEDGRIHSLRIDSGGKLRIHARPESHQRWALEIAARNWTLPAGPKVVFDRIDASAVMDGARIETRDLVARLYGGRVSGAVTVEWKPSWTVSGAGLVEDVRLQPLGALLTGNRGISGRLHAKPRFTLHAGRAADLVASLELTSDFVVQDGTLHQIDLVAATRAPLAPQPKTGETRFDEVSGHLEIDAEGYHFSDLRVASGLLRATGEVSVGRDRRLAGRINAELRGTASMLTVPLDVSGMVGDPSVAPTKTAVAGALAGSVLLPGIGTAIGLKAGELTGRLFRTRRAPSTPRGRMEASESRR